MNQNFNFLIKTFIKKDVKELKFMNKVTIRDIDVSDKKDINIDIDINVNKSNNFKNNYNLPKSETNISKHDNSQSGFQNNRPINPYNNSGINKLNDNKKLSITASGAFNSSSLYKIGLKKTSSG